VTECNIYIAVIEHSHIIYEGLTNILLKSDHHFHIYRFNGIQELTDFKDKEKLHVVMINPSYVVSNKKNFNAVKKSLPNTYWVGILYSYFDKNTIELFDDTVEITENPEKIKETICRVSTDDCICREANKTEELSSREKDVLIELINGLSNKEIADKLFISTHTVASHRKKITRKTGIKSLSGLTIYAITQKIISIE